MKITFLGTATSMGIPVIACDCAACVSNDPKDKRLRVSILVEMHAQTILIDVGPDFRQQMLRSQTDRLDAILITHEHSDHVAGLDDIRPFNFRSGKDMPIYTTEVVQKVLREKHPYIFAAQYPGVPRVAFRTISKETAFKVGKIEIIPVEIYHGEMPILGFRINDFAYLTDFKSIREEELHKLSGLKTLVVSALQHKKHHSHASLQESIDFVASLGKPKSYFTHLSHKLGTHAATSRLLPSHIQLAYDGLILEL
jgi:phosphoribosyl 1,2-cyclic phosphate phosphodiesterase